MGANRIRGQEVSLQVIANNNVQVGISNIRDFEITTKLAKTEEGYLGKTTQDFDEMFNGYDGKISIHSSDEGVFDFTDIVKARAQRRVPGTVINIRATLNYPNGDRPRFIYKDCSFGDIPESFTSRAAYGTVSIPFSCSDRQRIG